MRFVAGAAVASLICCSLALVARTQAANRAAPVPDFSGQWGRAGLFRFEQPPSGPGPVTNTSRFPDTVERVGDYTNPILTPQSAEIVKQRGPPSSWRWNLKSAFFNGRTRSTSSMSMATSCAVSA